MILERPSGNLYYEEYGRADAELVVCLNGFASGISNWYPIVRTFKKKYRVVLYDYLGTGGSQSRPNYRFCLQSYCEDLEALLDSMCVASAHIVGYSLGGWIAQEFVADRSDRVKSLVLVNTSSRIFTLQEWIIKHFIEVLQLPDISIFSKLMFISYYSPEYFEGKSDHLNRIRELADQYFQKHDRENWLDMLSSCLVFNREDAIRSITQPVLLVSGSTDYLCPRVTAKRLQELIPNLQWEEFAEVGHAIPMERHQDLGVIINEFLNGHADVR